MTNYLQFEQIYSNLLMSEKISDLYTIKSLSPTLKVLGRKDVDELQDMYVNDICDILEGSKYQLQPEYVTYDKVTHLLNHSRSGIHITFPKVLNAINPDVQQQAYIPFQISALNQAIVLVENAQTAQQIELADFQAQHDMFTLFKMTNYLGAINNIPLQTRNNVPKKSYANFLTELSEIVTGEEIEYLEAKATSKKIQRAADKTCEVYKSVFIK